MLLIRRFEEKAGQLYGMGLIGGFCHLYIGQEAVVVGMQMAIRQGDQVITTYRDHGHMLACGMDPKGVMAELTGRRGGYSKGKGGSMHMFSKEKNFYGGHGIVGANVPLGAGIAFANRYRGNGAVCLTYFGDGAANQGQVYESFNMAKLWKLPVVFIVENNKYAMGTSVERSAATTDFSQRGRSFDIPGEQVDGMDVRAVKATGERVVQWVREGNGPYILEMLTYRYRGHSMSDPAKYRTRDEIQKMREEQRPDRAGAPAPAGEQSGLRGRAEGDRRRGARRRQRRGRVRPEPTRSRTRASFIRMCWWLDCRLGQAKRRPNACETLCVGSSLTLDPTYKKDARGNAHRDPDARAVAHHGGGQARQMAGRGGPERQAGRRHRRDRDRQGHHGGGGGRRGQGLQAAGRPKAPRA